MDVGHSFAVAVAWRGNRGSGTSGPRDFGREVAITGPDRPPIDGAAARAFHGDATRWNPEELLIAALAECHLLSYLHVATRAGVVVVSYADDATGELEVSRDGSGRLTSVTLRPRVVVSSGAVEAARALHDDAHRVCFIANSVNFPVVVEPVVTVAG